MAITLADTTRNARLDAIETDLGTSAILKIRTGAPPATVATASSGTVLATCTLPSDWMAAASAGAKAKSGTWEDTSADAAGTAGHFELCTSGGTVKVRGTVGQGSGDMSVDNTNFAVGQQFTVTTFVLTDGNA